MDKLHSRLGEVSRLLLSYSHEKTLERGFALVRNKDGEVVTRVAQTLGNHLYSVEFSDGQVAMRTEGPGTKPETTGNPPEKKAANKQDEKKPSVQKELFD
jgi:exodeoxyribonuclease VII large subunit